MRRCWMILAGGVGVSDLLTVAHESCELVMVEKPALEILMTAREVLQLTTVVEPA